MANTELNSDDVSAALSLLNTAAADLKSRLLAKGYVNAQTSVCGYGFSVYPNGFDGGNYRQQVSIDKALAHIDALPVAQVWTPSLCEQTLGVREAA